VTVTATSTATSAHLSAVLVDLGPETIRNHLGDAEGITDLGTLSCYGESTPGNSACFLDTAADTETVSVDLARSVLRLAVVGGADQGTGAVRGAFPWVDTHWVYTQ